MTQYITATSTTIYPILQFNVCDVTSAVKDANQNGYMIYSENQWADIITALQLYIFSIISFH